MGNLDPNETLQFFKDLLKIGGPKTEVMSFHHRRPRGKKIEEYLQGLFADLQFVLQAGLPRLLCRFANPLAMLSVIMAFIDSCKSFACLQVSLLIERF